MQELKNTIDKTWTLFIDRDGVINKRLVDDYVKSWSEFEFLPGVLESFKIFSGKFGRIIVVTNQQGVGKGLMNEKVLKSIHNNMVREIESHGGRVDAIFYCTDLKNKENNCRKPSPKMFENALADFPDISPEKSIMAGDSESDIEFGKNAGIFTVYIGNDKINADLNFGSLKDFAEYLK